MLSKDIFVPLTICIDQTRRALVIVLQCYGALEIVGVIIIIIIIVWYGLPTLILEAVDCTGSSCCHSAATLSICKVQMSQRSLIATHQLRF